MDSVSERNFKAVQAAINILESRYQNMSQEIEHLKTMITQLSSQSMLINQQLAVLRASSLGRGPTVGA